MLGQDDFKSELAGSTVKPYFKRGEAGAGETPDNSVGKVLPTQA